MDLVEKVKILLKSENVNTDLLNFDAIKTFLKDHKEHDYNIYLQYKSSKLDKLYLMCGPTDENPNDNICMVSLDWPSTQRQFLYLQP